MDKVSMLAVKLGQLWPHLNEKSRRMVAAVEAVQFGYGGITKVSKLCGLSRVTITHGIAELKSNTLAPERIRSEGGGRRSLTHLDPELPAALEALVDPLSRGDPESPLRWTLKSTRALAHTLTGSGHQISHERVAQLLRELGYSLQSNRKGEEGEDHPDRDAQFQHINREVKRGIHESEPVISVDTKKKELIGNYRNSGQTWRPEGMAEKVQGHDFPGPEVPRAFPYGIYDLAQNRGFVNVGVDHDTATFAVASIRGWWRSEGQRLYPTAKYLLITADGRQRSREVGRLCSPKVGHFAVTGSGGGAGSQGKILVPPRHTRADSGRTRTVITTSALLARFSVFCNQDRGAL